MPANAYPKLKAIVHELIKTPDVREVKRADVEALIHREFGIHPKTLEQYMRVLDTMGVIGPTQNYHSLQVLPRGITPDAYQLLGKEKAEGIIYCQMQAKEMSKENIKLMEAEMLRRKPGLDEKPVIGSPAE